MSETRPTSKAERRRNRALTRFAGLVYRNLRRQARRVDRLETQVQKLCDELDELRDDLRDVARQTARVTYDGAGETGD